MSDLFSFRIWDNIAHTYSQFDGWDALEGDLPSFGFAVDPDHECDIEVEQCIGVYDKYLELYYVGDIGEFDNGDRFVIKCDEDILEISIEWIGDAICEDQARYLERIGGASRKRGNIHKNPELLIPDKQT